MEKGRRLERVIIQETYNTQNKVHSVYVHRKMLNTREKTAVYSARIIYAITSHT